MSILVFSFFLPRATSFENLVDVVGFEDDIKNLLAEILKHDFHSWNGRVGQDYTCE